MTRRLDPPMTPTTPTTSAVPHLGGVDHRSARRCSRSATCASTTASGAGAVRAITDASFTLRRGEVLGLAGESGSGKSTLAYALTRLLRAPGVITDGEVLLPRARPGGSRPPMDLLAADAGRTAPNPLVAAVRGLPERHARAQPGGPDRTPS